VKTTNEGRERTSGDNGGKSVPITKSKKRVSNEKRRFGKERKLFP